MRSRAQVLVRLFTVLDFLLLLVIVAAVWRPVLGQSLRELFILLLLAPVWILLLQLGGVYRSHRLEGLSGFVRQLILTQLLAILIFGALLLSIGLGHRLRQLGFICLIGTVTIFLERALLYSVLRYFRKRGFDLRNVCVIGDWENAQQITTRFADNAEWGLRVTSIGTGAEDGRRFTTFPGREHLADSLPELLQTHVVDEVMIAVAPEKLSSERATLASCREHGIIARVLLNAPSEPAAAQIEGFLGKMSITMDASRNRGAVAVAKRVIDLLLGGILLVLCFPVMAATAILVKLSSPGPIFFRQMRTGLHGRSFRMYKFRTMVDGAESMVHSLAHLSVTNGPVFKHPNDCRITPVGRILRRFSLDELPQLLNVLKGEMSLVGPRPLPLHEAAAISGPKRRRFAMRPGITCLWQVNGRSEIEYSQWMSYDLQYVDNWSLWLDAKLLAQTIPAVLSGRGAY